MSVVSPLQYAISFPFAPVYAPFAAEHVSLALLSPPVSVDLLAILESVFLQLKNIDMRH